ncbi:MAG TPA: methyltransferase domain-containing protein [Pyrinomonadaceae bacterium]|jgi:2-polyprenyl-3-methyl-5-hydroxy-6-metoxy-1,4-benzoquinol methylase
MDEIAKYNQARWKELVRANALFTRPKLNLDPNSARKIVDFDGRLGDVSGKDVLCLASGGGQQSAAFALLGANVTVFDLSREQLERDLEAALHYGFDVKIKQGDMRDLSEFEKSSFDVVNHAYSLNFVPDAVSVFRQVARILRPGGIYHFSCANPFVMGTGQSDWNGEGYILKKTYTDKAQISYEDQDWVYERDSDDDSIRQPIEYRHTLASLFNGLIENNLLVFHVSDNCDMYPDENAAPGTWEHFVAFAPPWLSIWASYRPDLEVE